MTREYEITVAYLDPNPYSRPQSKMKDIKGVALHWVGNANSTAINNRNYFNNLPIHNKNNREKAQREGKSFTPRYASSHEIIGLKGEVVICLPNNEVAYHVGAKSYKPRVKTLLNNSPNRHLYGIEVCHPDWSGKYSSITYKTVVNRVADLMIEFDLVPSKDTIWRHYDVTGKDCPHFYVQNPKEWDKLVNDIVKRYYEKINEKAEEVIKVELAKWQEEMGKKAVENLSQKKVNGELIVNNPETWSKSLGEPTPQWLFWSIIDRITK